MEFPSMKKNIYYGNYWYDSGKEIVRLMLDERDTLPEAIACANDCMAIGVAAELFSHQIRVPEQIAVIGYDSTDEGKGLRCPLTSAEIPSKECGAYCVRYIDARLAGDEAPEFQGESSLFIGGSCGCKVTKEMVKHEVPDEKREFLEYRFCRCRIWNIFQ